MSNMPVGILLAQIKQLQSRIIEKKLKSTSFKDLNGSQINILYQLWLEDDITISQLSARTNLANTTLTTMLDRLEKLGQIRRQRNENNRREIRIQLTDSAKNIQQDGTTLLEEMHAINFNGFSTEEETLMYSLLLRMKQNLEEENDNYGHKY
ncbi:MarR family transcriptional regulator [Anaerosporobacter sp.]|uniref:MarR family transcriptional regulator n=1 Tax=Anaerosporobacter sp. TaxID=1872529 RepID=UPI00286F221D|nr:MarR family transcriptional regulator [Anaerosporobacter sp.]